MTTPTQAQIEAALKEYQNPKYDAVDDGVIVKAVLTAAAQVGERPMHELSRELFQQFGIVLDQSGNGHHMRDPAAAQVGEPIKKTDWHTRTLDRDVEIIRTLKDEIKQTKATTIERCAQVVRGFHIRHDESAYVLLCEIEAAIRKLKDLP